MQISSQKQSTKSIKQQECDSLERTIEKLKDALVHDSSKQVSLVKINRSTAKLSENSLKYVEQQNLRIETPESFK